LARPQPIRSRRLFTHSSYTGRHAARPALTTVVHIVHSTYDYDETPVKGRIPEYSGPTARPDVRSAYRPSALWCRITSTG